MRNAPASANFPLSLPFLPVSGWLMAVLLCRCFVPPWESKCFYSLTELLLYYNLEKRGIFGVPSRILWDTGTELFTTHKTGTNGIPVATTIGVVCII